MQFLVVVGACGAVYVAIREKVWKHSSPISIQQVPVHVDVREIQHKIPLGDFRSPRPSTRRYGAGAVVRRAIILFMGLLFRYSGAALLVTFFWEILRNFDRVIWNGRAIDGVRLEGGWGFVDVV